MDWFSWLSQTSLEPSLVYNYGVIFACNELTLNDIAYFDHDFLLSMGVVIAKHRLEILKLAQTKPIAKTHLKLPKFLKSFASKFRKMGGRKIPTDESGDDKMGRSKLSPLKVEWKEINVERSGPLKSSGPVELKKTRKYVSGPINGGLPVVARSPRFSGPLDRRVSFGRSPMSSVQFDGSEAHSPWAMLFDDLKPN